MKYLIILTALIFSSCMMGKYTYLKPTEGWDVHYGDSKYDSDLKFYYVEKDLCDSVGSFVCNMKFIFRMYGVDKRGDSIDFTLTLTNEENENMTRLIDLGQEQYRQYALQPVVNYFPYFID